MCREQRLIHPEAGLAVLAPLEADSLDFKFGPDQAIEIGAAHEKIAPEHLGAAVAAARLLTEPQPRFLGKKCHLAL